MMDLEPSDLPIISCLIPVFNGERYLELALDSILNQTFADFEIVVVDDGSVDGSGEILARYARQDDRIKLVRKNNGGIVSALNLGLQHCAGKLIARMDGDDIATPDRFAIQLAEFQEKPDAVAVGGQIQMIDEAGMALATPSKPSRVEETRLFPFPPVVANVQHSAGTFLKSAMLAVGGYRSTFPHAEDYDLYLRLAEHGRFYNPDKLVLFYRVHAGSLSMRNLERQETSAVLAEMSAYARNAKLPDPGDADEPLGVDDYAAALGDRFPAPTIRRYIAFRMWRRLAGARDPQETSYRRDVLRDVLAKRHYRTALDRQLNRRIALSMGRKLVRTLRYDPWRFLGRRASIKLAK